MSQDPSQSPGGDADDDVIDHARDEFEQQFRQGHLPSRPGAGVLDQRDGIFMRTIYDAIAIGKFDWNASTNVRRKEFALRCVAEIASMARYESGGDKVTLAALKQAEKFVIRYWKSRCPVIDGEPEEIFCRLYDVHGEPLPGYESVGRVRE